MTLQYVTVALVLLGLLCSLSSADSFCFASAPSFRSSNRFRPTRMVNVFMSTLALSHNIDAASPDILCCSSLGEGQKLTDSLREHAGQEGKLVGMDIESRRPPKLLENEPPNPRKGMYRTANDAASNHHNLVLVRDILSISDHLQLGDSFDVCFVDLTIILGNDLLLDTISLLRQLERIYPCLRTIVVKSRALSDNTKKLRNAVKIASGQSNLDRVQTKRSWMEKNTTKVVCSRGVEEYRSVIDTVVRPGDRVLEIGCHFGTTTAILARAVGSQGTAIGVDIGESIIAAAKHRFPHIDFHVCDAYDTFGLLQLGGQGVFQSFDVIFLDVGGLSGTSGLLEALALLRQLTNAMGSRLRTIVIKSACMQEHAERCLVAHEELNPHNTHSIFAGEHVQENCPG